MNYALAALPASPASPASPVPPPGPLANFNLSERLEFKGRVPLCPICSGGLGADRDCVASSSGFVYRKRLCRDCGAVVHTKQSREEVTGVEYLEGDEAERDEE